MNPITLIRAHQFCYYVLGTPVITDQEYDELCKKHGIDGSGGSDLYDSYSFEERNVAAKMIAAKIVPKNP